MQCRSQEAESNGAVPEGASFSKRGWSRPDFKCIQYNPIATFKQSILSLPSANREIHGRSAEMGEK